MEFKNILILYGYAEYYIKHINIVSKRAGKILEKLGYSKERIELAQIAGYLHTIGYCVNRIDYANSGAILAYNILKDLGMEPEDRTQVMMSIAALEQKTDEVTSDISAALILADLSDTWDKVNYPDLQANLITDAENSKLKLDLTVDTKLCSVLNCFEMFMDRTRISKYAAKYFDLRFELIINDTKLL